jgi:hypothetical protein
MATKKELVVTDRIAHAIHFVPGQKVMLDFDLAALDGASTKALNRAVSRRFSELEARVGKPDENIAAIIEAIRQLIALPEKPRREIGFHVHQTAPRYGTRKAR